MTHSEEILENLATRAHQALECDACATVAFCERFFEGVEALWSRAPQEALRPAEVALQLAAAVPRGAASRMERDQLKARALGVLGGVWRSLGRYEEAEAAYHLAAELAITLGDELGLADLARRLATLRRDQQRFEEARRLAGSAIECYRRLGEQRGLPQALVEMGLLLGYERREPRRSIHYFRQALEHLDPARDPVFYRCAIHNLAGALCLSEDDRDLPGALWLGRLRRAGSFEAGSAGAAKTRWLEGLVAQRRGDPDPAEIALIGARDELLALGLAVEAATVSMDLARLYLELGRGEDARRLAGELFPIFRALRSHREASAALSLYVNAAMVGQLSIELVRRVRGVVGAQGLGPVD